MGSLPKGTKVLKDKRTKGKKVLMDKRTKRQRDISKIKSTKYKVKMMK